MSDSAAIVLADTLAGYGVTHLFQVPAVLRRTLAELERRHPDIARITTHGEKAAAYMADGYARVAGRPGVCAAQAVGALNLCAGLREPFLAGSPVLAFTGGRLPETQFRHAYQEADDLPAFDQVTKFNGVIAHPDRFADMVGQAFRVAVSGRPGPVHLQVQGNEGQLELSPTAVSAAADARFAAVPPFRPLPSDEELDAALSALLSAQRPVIVAGGGVRSSRAGATCRSTDEIKFSGPPLRLDAGKCSWTGRTVRAGHVSAQVPRPGMTVMANALLTSADGEESLRVSSAVDGTVTVTTGELANVPARSAAAQPACSDAAFSAGGKGWGPGGTYQYWYNSGGQPFGDALGSIVLGSLGIINDANDCGIGGRPNVNQTFFGQTGVQPSVNDSGGCTTYDTTNVTGWGSMPEPILGLTCTWSWSDGLHAASDQKYNTHYPWWSGSGGCPNGNSFDLRGVATHEMGHAYGLGHPAGDHELTMNSSIPSCNTSRQTLGLGDVLGLDSIYGRI